MAEEVAGAEAEAEVKREAAEAQGGAPTLLTLLTPHPALALSLYCNH